MKASDIEAEFCSLARSASVIGDRWTLMILRDCFLRVRRFDDFHERLGMSRPLLADRLQKLVDAFILTKVAYQQGPTRCEYRLTQKGLDLHPVIMAMVHWADVHMSGRKGRPAIHIHHDCDHAFDPMMTCSECGEAIGPRSVTVLPAPTAPRIPSPYRIAETNADPGLARRHGRKD